MSYMRAAALARILAHPRALRERKHARDHSVGGLTCTRSRIHTNAYMHACMHTCTYVRGRASAGLHDRFLAYR